MLIQKLFDLTSYEDVGEEYDVGDVGEEYDREYLITLEHFNRK